MPNNFDALKVLGSLYAHTDHADTNVVAERREKARDILKKCSEMEPDDVEILLDLAQLQEQNDPLVIFKCVKKIYEKFLNIPFSHLE